MSYFWFISNCSSFFCFRLSLLFAFILSLSLWYLSLCGCLIASLFSSLYLKFLSSYLPLFFECFFFLVFCFFSRCCLFFLCIFQYSLFEYLVLFLLVEVMLSCGIVIPSIQVRPALHLLRRLFSFSIYSPSIFSSCFLFWHGHSSIRTIIQFLTPNPSNDFIERGWRVWGLVLFI